MARGYASMTSQRSTTSRNPQGQMQGDNQRNWIGGQRGFFRGGRQQFRGKLSGGRQGGRQPWQKINSNVEEAQMRTMEGNKSQNVQCFSCGGNHYAAFFPNRGGQQGGRSGRIGQIEVLAAIDAVILVEWVLWRSRFNERSLDLTPGQGGTVHQKAPNDGVLHHPGTQSQGN